MKGILHFEVNINSIEVTFGQIKSDYGTESVYVFQVAIEKSYISSHDVYSPTLFEIKFYESIENVNKLIDAIMIESLLHKVEDYCYTIEKISIIFNKNWTYINDKKTFKVQITGRAQHSLLNGEISLYTTEFLADIPFATILNHILESNIGYGFTRYIDDK